MFMSTMLAHCKVVEVSILIADELLACPADQDFVRKETSSLVTKEERISKTGDMNKRHEMHYKRQLFWLVKWRGEAHVILPKVQILWVSAFSRKFVRGRTLDSGFATTISSTGFSQSTIGWSIDNWKDRTIENHMMPWILPCFDTGPQILKGLWFMMNADATTYSVIVCWMGECD